MVTHILVPTDMSEASGGITRYALSLAARVNASVTLLHVYQLPTPATDVPIVMYDAEEIREENIRSLAEHCNNWKVEFPSLHIAPMSSPGTVEAAVLDAAKDVKAGLIIMSLTPERDLAHIIFGHNALDVVNHVHTPVLIVPHETTYSDPARVMLAFDYKKVKDWKRFNMLFYLAKAWNAEVMVVHVLEQGMPRADQAAVGLGLSGLLRDVRHSWHFPESENTLQGLHEFIRDTRPDMVVMMHHSRGFIKRLFSTEHTKEIMQKEKVPLLVLEE